MPWHNRKDSLQRIADSHGVDREFVRQWSNVLNKLDNGQISQEQADKLASNLMDEHPDQVNQWLGDGDTSSLYW